MPPSHQDQNGDHGLGSKDALGGESEGHIRFRPNQCFPLEQPAAPQSSQISHRGDGLLPRPCRSGGGILDVLVPWDRLGIEEQEYSLAAYPRLPYIPCPHIPPNPNLKPQNHSTPPLHHTRSPCIQFIKLIIFYILYFA
jgi:hypothetical protein